MTAPTSLPIVAPPVPDGPLPRWLADVIARICLDAADREYAAKMEGDR